MPILWIGILSFLQSHLHRDLDLSWLQKVLLSPPHMMPGRGSWTDNPDGMRHARSKHEYLLFSSPNTEKAQISAWCHVNTRKSYSFLVDLPRCTKSLASVASTALGPLVQLLGCGYCCEEAHLTRQLVDGCRQTLDNDCIIYDHYLFSDVQIFTLLSFLLQTV